MAPPPPPLSSARGRWPAAKGCQPGSSDARCTPPCCCGLMVPLNLHNAAGIRPTNWLSLRSTKYRFLRLPRDSGIAPLNWFPQRYNCPKFVRLPRDSGIAPLSWLFAQSNIYRSRLRNSWGFRLGAVLNSPGEHPFALDRRLDAGSGGPAARREVEVGLFRRVADRAPGHGWVTDAHRAPKGRCRRCAGYVTRRTSWSAVSASTPNMQ